MLNFNLTFQVQGLDDQFDGVQYDWPPVHIPRTMGHTQVGVGEKARPRFVLLFLLFLFLFLLLLLLLLFLFLFLFLVFLRFGGGKVVVPVVPTNGQVLSE